MAYADRDTTGSRIVTIVIVSIIVAAFGYAFVTGLAYKYVKKAAEKLNTFDVAEPPPPPPDKPPPPPPDQPQVQPPPVVSPPPIVQVQSPPPVIQTVQTPPPAAPMIPVAAPPPPPPAPPRVSKAAGLKGNPGQFFGPDAYPAAALRAEAQGRVVAKLTIGTDGRVTDCVVTTSSGNADLDSTTCSVAKRRVKFSPALDDNGNGIVSTYTLPVKWVLPE